jgi:hypothetical protein
MRDGERLPSVQGLTEARARCAEQLAQLPGELRSLNAPYAPYPVAISTRIRALAAVVDARTTQTPGVLA